MKELKLYYADIRWLDNNDTSTAIVCVGKPSFLDKLCEEWTEDEEIFDANVFFYYDSIDELKQAVEDGDKVYNSEFAITNIHHYKTSELL
jgi:hypothetical protein